MSEPAENIATVQQHINLLDFRLLDLDYLDLIIQSVIELSRLVVL